RKQIEDDLKANAGKLEAERALRDIDRKLLEVELRLVSRTEMHSDDKWYVESYKVYQNLIWLNGVVNSGAGDVAGGADERPTDASVGVLDAPEQGVERREGRVSGGAGPGRGRVQPRRGGKGIATRGRGKVE